MRVALFDYGVGNLHSLEKALEAGGGRVTVTTDWKEALSHEALVLPGVGSFPAAARKIDTGRDRLRRALEGGLPCLGICLGMQLLFEGSEEGPGEGLGVIPGRVRTLKAARLPHMGWNEVEFGSDPLFRGVRPFFAYFAHSYVCEPEQRSHVTAFAQYEGSRFVAGVRRHRTWGLQFHPEKSSRNGLRILENFLCLAAEGTGVHSPTGDRKGVPLEERRPGAGSLCGARRGEGRGEP